VSAACQTVQDMALLSLVCVGHSIAQALSCVFVAVVVLLLCFPAGHSIDCRTTKAIFRGRSGQKRCGLICW